MDARVIHSLLTATPFRPFTLATTRTGTHDVRTPADVLLTRTAIHLVIERGADGIADDVMTIGLKQVTRVEVHAA